MIHRALILVALGLALAGCNQPVGSPASEDVNCSVIKFTAEAEPEQTAPVCAVECRWAAGNRGYASATPVPCNWYGRRVIRR